jgi:tRNA uridine 5-carboxymethylaminomethyl modification enzyme
MRLKTGTPARILGSTIDLSVCEVQAGDQPPRPFSFVNSQAGCGHRDCLIAWTDKALKDVILANLHRAPMYNGQITSVGPKYCPSIEDKVVRFGDRDRHQVFLEPEGLDTDEWYVNGLSTSLPIDVQAAFLAAVPALRNAHVMRFGYAVEYDAVRSDQLDHRLAVRSLPGLYCAGQINGTSGYEEAGMQGLIAGANAALVLAGKQPLVLSRADGYGGVMVDDLVTRSPDEPYRMFTSRAEHRLYLRSDNADRRLGPLAARAGLISPERAQAVANKDQTIRSITAKVSVAIRRHIAGEAIPLEKTIELLPILAEQPFDVQEGVWIELRYEDYLKRQGERIERLARHRDVVIAADTDWTSIPGLSSEARRCLKLAKPQSLGEAENLNGVSPADIETVWAWCQNRRGKG